MSKENLPEKTNPFRLAEANATLEGCLSIKDMLRLRMSLAEDSGEVQVKMTFGTDPEGVRFMRGHFEARVTVQCQRCMEPFVCGIMGDFLSGIVKTEEEAERLANPYEPVFVDEENMFVVQEVIEDELIVSMPIVPMHDPKDCKVSAEPIVLVADDDSKVGENNPFNVIKVLRSKKS